jgi:Ca-activated chloride channel family protein
MTFNPEDPKWTAYVLGELEDSERAEVDSLLESSEEARAYVEELRVATGALEHELKVELKVGFPPEINAALAAGMTEAQRAAILAAAGASNNIRWFRQPQAWAGGLAIAATILIAIAVPSLWKAQKVDGTANAPVQSAGVVKTEDSISPSPAVVSESVSKPEGRNETETSNNNKVAQTEHREVIVTRDQSEQSKLTAPPAPQPVQPLSGISSTPAGSPAAVKQEAATTVAVLPPNAAGNPPAGGNTIIRDVFPPIVAPRPTLGGGGGRGGGNGTGGVFGTAQGGTISGSVSDSSGALIPGVTVMATNTETGVARTTLTNESGAYNFVGLTPGPYRLNATLGGFQTAILVNINLGTSESQRYDIAMKIGTAGTTVEVATDTQSILSQSSASIGAVSSEQRVQNLPLVGNNVLDLIGTLQGVQGAQSQNFSGLSANNINTTRDGLSVNGGTPNGVSSSTVVNPDMIGEVRMILGPVDTEVGRANGQIQTQGRQAGQGGQQGQGQQAARGGGGAPAAGAAAAAPPPPPPAAVRAPARIIPDNPTVVGGFNNYDRPATPNSASYAPIIDNPFRRVSQEPLSTFSSDVDTASYANLRRFINQNQLPPAAAVRIEEMVNYFNYDYSQPSAKDPIGASMEIASAPWNPTHRLVRIGIKARDIDSRKRPSSNLVFLIDVSGSMQPPERLPLIKNGLKMLVGSLTENDHVSIVVYAGASGVVLPSTSGNRRDIINAALDRLEAGGSTNGGAGIQLAYQIATSNFIQGGVNRVILATDGDFNVGVTNQTQLTRLIQDSAKSGVFLSVLGVGTDNLKDSTMERLADTGNGNYAYLDSLNEAYKVLVEQMSGTLVTVAKDVKLQVEFNPAVVEAYRLIGYENRLLANADFNNDRKDAGDMGAGHTVTALYEIVPRGGSVPGPDIDPLKYQTPAPTPAAATRNGSTETLTLKIRYKDPDGTESKLLSLPLTDREGTFSKASADFRFAASVAEFGMILRDSPYRGKASVGEVIENAQASKGSDRNGYRQEFIGLVQRARQLRGRE